MGCFGCLGASVGFLQKFGGIINFTGSDLAEGQLSNGLCKSMDSDVFGRSWSLHSKGLSLFFRPTPCGFRQVVQQLSKPVANDINYLIRTGANAVVAAKVNWKRTDT